VVPNRVAIDPNLYSAFLFGAHDLSPLLLRLARLGSGWLRLDASVQWRFSRRTTPESTPRQSCYRSLFAPALFQPSISSVETTDNAIRDSWLLEVYKYLDIGLVSNSLSPIVLPCILQKVVHRNLVNLF